ncbi:UDP-glycosyltransferase 87A1-like [Cucumis melo var. makuwa]|uniref:UDP-glycosyltransferase 87A1-like n=2 Tax=Cucumis melo TaxID=3656 RepID=A0A1S3CNH7_CUCME|nr:UDP-glycosyltransferase 87A1-like [Cucumis melo]KAA0067358.1 UDP-glycosyltransferase 87A1-like [Cucumis melo var. makuwa]TYK30664.1 UDP-glycosyltransferase 87A1-like [Cucumis melo var. makuwa]
MDSTISKASQLITHLAALPYPGRGHINALMNFCKLLFLKNPNILISFIVSEEWLSFLAADPKPPNLHFSTFPNIIPSELGRANDYPGFFRSVNTILESPIHTLLTHLNPPPSIIVADPFLSWAVPLANRLNIPVASFWPMSVTVLSCYYHFNLLEENGHFPANLSERGEEIVDYIPGVSHTRLADFPTFFSGDGHEIRDLTFEAARSIDKAQFLISTSVYELEPSVVDVFKLKCPFPVYTIGPCTPYFETPNGCTDEYLQWLDSQTDCSVLYISHGSFLSVSSAQMDEIVAGVEASGVRFLWVARGNDSRLKGVDREMGMVVRWCDQLKVLCHSAVGGFWTHCGWNSTMEGVFAGVPMLTWPIFLDQVPNRKKIVEDWKVGVRVNAVGGNDLVRREEIAKLVKRFMNSESVEGRKMRNRVSELKDICRRAVVEGGSSHSNMDAFIGRITI